MTSESPLDCEKLLPPDTRFTLNGAPAIMLKIKRGSVYS